MPSAEPASDSSKQGKGQAERDWKYHPAVSTFEWLPLAREAPREYRVVDAVEASPQKTLQPLGADAERLQASNR
jgi:hypothetical protein